MKTFLKISAVLVLLFVVGVVACTAMVGGAIDHVDKEMKKTRTLTYEVSGPGKVAYFNANSTAMEDAPAAWSKDVTLTGWDLASVSVTGGVDSRTVSCRILEGGKVLVEQSATGQFASASCSGVK